MIDEVLVLMAFFFCIVIFFGWGFLVSAINILYFFHCLFLILLLICAIYYAFYGEEK